MGKPQITFAYKLWVGLMILTSSISLKSSLSNSCSHFPNFVAQPVQNMNYALRNYLNMLRCKTTKRLYAHQTNMSDFEILALEFSVITVAPLGIVCPCGTLRTCSSSALSSFDEQKFIWQTSSSSFLGLHLGLKLDDHCEKKKSTTAEKMLS